jgi:hypothetical protein
MLSQSRERIVYGKLVIEKGQLASFRATLDSVLGTRDDLALYCPDLHRALGDHARAAADDKSWTALAYSSCGSRVLRLFAGKSAAK